MFNENFIVMRKKGLGEKLVVGGWGGDWGNKRSSNDLFRQDVKIITRRSKAVEG